MRFSGVWLPVITPFKDGEVDHASYERLVDRYVRAGIAGTAPSGSRVSACRNRSVSPPVARAP